MPLPTLTVALLQDEARLFAALESVHPEPAIYGVTDGKAIGTYLEHKFQAHLEAKYVHAPGNSALGIDLPGLAIDMKVTSVRQPQSSCPFKHARQKIHGLGYSLLVFVYDKTDDDANRTATLNILHTIFIEAHRTADFQMTRGLLDILARHGNDDDLVAFMQDKMLPVDEIEVRRIAEELFAYTPGAGLPDHLERPAMEAPVWTGHHASRARGRSHPHKVGFMATRNRQGGDEFGDFQTPPALAAHACKLLAERRGLEPASVVEPTCGIGGFLCAALDRFPFVKLGLGVEINPTYVDRLTASLRGRAYAGRVRVLHENFFEADWTTLLRDLPEPILVCGNPPWVTNSQLGALGSENLPTKTNFQNRVGLDAITGKSNFDISEWMLIKLLELLQGRRATLAMLCKTAVARKVLVHAWKNDICLADAEIRPIDAGAFFGAAVEACLLICSLVPSGHNRDCRVYQDMDGHEPTGVIGYHDDQLVADALAYERWKHLKGREVYKWRSGVKHDCSKVMELRKEGTWYRNGLGQLVDLEDDYLFPMLKSSELANGRTQEPSRLMLVPQKATGDDTNMIRVLAPKTWKYLQEHGETLDRRASSIYRNRPRFSVFGVGEYTFSPWKVAISGFYKRLHFATIGSVAGKPIVPDDTGYFVSCHSEEEAAYLASLLNSDTAREFFSAYIFWDAKRPITVDVLKRLDLSTLARELGTENTLKGFDRRKNPVSPDRQSTLFEAS